MGRRDAQIVENCHQRLVQVSDAVKSTNSYTVHKINNINLRGRIKRS